LKRLTLAFLLLAAAPACSYAADPALHSLAREYLKVVPVRETVEDTLSAILAPADAAQGKKLALLFSKMDFGKVEAAMERSLEARFTADELRTAISINSTPEGKAIRKKTLLVSQDINGVLAAEITSALKAAMAADKGE